MKKRFISIFLVLIVVFIAPAYSAKQIVYFNSKFEKSNPYKIYTSYNGFPNNNLSKVRYQKNDRTVTTERYDSKYDDLRKEQSYKLSQGIVDNSGLGKDVVYEKRNERKYTQRQLFKKDFKSKNKQKISYFKSKGNSFTSSEAYKRNYFN